MRDQIWFMVLVLAVVGSLAGMALSAVKSVTDPVIEKRILETKIKPSLDDFFGPLQPDNDVIADRIVLDLGKDSRGRKLRLSVFTAKKGGKVIGAALQTAGGGYGGDIQVLTAFDLVQEEILGVKTLDQKETQGLGARVANDKEPFIQQFKGMKFSSGIKLRANGGEVDAISGASISSTAYAEAVDRAAALLEERRADIIGK
ncbi:MAG: RnfABCDGE type electron transport complex subunit G [Candidatus Eisenbacteria bacterium]|uniref:Ion-translocating oxidoreductase complex subunit G n=1 Tax=Eiseniibacteriota bacterium TaxID=2212470 RepID=A0A948RUA3_UNCEI|nr:RnfABCDGE type electron transport complex subunit G [Candidatus Eisenbacteria bacterium]MBU1951265.1 RnfABCDGE type electron transport complex subunit G [Candidatus Eisenbacteria bacterium]MBU2691005.1 RnfABCDGE type electron transport complex subunit G [Candidatus Eisenbacteria bacterium]